MCNDIKNKKFKKKLDSILDDVNNKIVRTDLDGSNPVDIITTVIENLLDNARNKRSREPDLQITVTLSTHGDDVHLTVTDTGSPITPQVHEHLFKEVVSSHDGFGIGLYQSYELAQNHGFDLTVADNNPGNVSFSLTRASC